ncbi:PREDICTED: trypsin-1-like [Ceratosolen solmsi marchali]|uniref:Trypsin-1-like n=1 Tax=Ceratosolen solmsi marchali TaxID=326594 RepID=A0AAJ7DZP8_9HYME|nr:PREDICTED: trypsin-1-like [Ceratosolen solmsi marchali]
MAIVPVIGNMNCAKVIMDIGLLEMNYDTQMCTGLLDGKISACSYMSYKLVILVSLVSIIFSDLIRVEAISDTISGQFPYVASMQWGMPPFIRLKHICAGTIIKPDWILTLGSCVTSSPNFGRTVIKVGIYDILHSDEHTQTIDVENFIIHEDYAGGIAPNDIALLKLKNRIIYNERVSPIDFPVQSNVSIETAVLIGWGSACNKFHPKLRQKLQTSTVSIITNEKCQTYCREIKDGSFIYDIQLCTIEQKILSTSPGDNGSPLVQNVMGKSVLIGIESWNLTPCGSAIPSPTVYTRVTSFLNWINSKISV